MRVKATGVLSPEEINRFLDYHIPHRLKFLRLGLALTPPFGSIDSAVIEVALMAGRQLIEFLGPGLEPKGPPTLKAKQCYKSFEGRCYEVKVINLVGEFQAPSKLQPHEKRIPAEFIYGADKSSAHLTEDSNHKLLG